jgi:hypothetical protein
VFAGGGGGGGAGGVLVGITGAGVAGRGVGVGFGVGVGVTEAVGVGVSVNVDAGSGRLVDGAPPPTPPLPRARLVAFEAVNGVWLAAANAQVKRRRLARTAQPATTALLEVERSNGNRERIFQPLAASRATRRTANPKNVAPRLPSAAASQITKRT